MTVYLQFALARYQAALACLEGPKLRPEQALEILAARDALQRALSAESQVAASLNSLAVLYVQMGNYAAAEPLHQRSLAIVEKVHGKEHPVVAASLNNLANLYQEQGNYAEAEPLHQRSLAIKEKVLGQEHPDVAYSLHNLAALYVQMGNYAEAEPLYQTALAIFEKVLGQEHPDVATILNNLASLYQAEGDILRALDFLTRSTNIEETNLTLILATGSDARKRAYMNTLSGTTNETVSLHLQDAPNNLQAARLALTTVLRRKGRVLDALTATLQTLRQNLTPEDQNLLDELTATRTQLAVLTFNPSQELPPEQYRHLLETLTAKGEQLEDSLSRHSAEFRRQTQPVTIETVQQLIPQNVALVELVLYQPFNPKAKPGERSNPRYAAYILRTQGTPQWIDLGDAEAIHQELLDFGFSLQDPYTPIFQVKQTARALDAKLMQPIRKLLGNTRTILLSPDAALNLIPFEALVDESERYLVETYSFTYLTAGRDLLRLQDSSPSQQPFQVYVFKIYPGAGEKSVIKQPVGKGICLMTDAKITKKPRRKQLNNRVEGLLRREDSLCFAVPWSSVSTSEVIAVKGGKLLADKLASACPPILTKNKVATAIARSAPAKLIALPEAFCASGVIHFSMMPTKTTSFNVFEKAFNPTTHTIPTSLCLLRT